MKKPNFFIIGAPKCGTTSMVMWLSKHPQIFMSPVKEPHYFNTDQYRVIKTESGYIALFHEASEKHRAIGEASVWYLYSEEAVPNILDYNPDAKFIVMLRNPADMAYSLHDQLLLSLYERVKNFEEAWRLQEMRAAGKEIPFGCLEPKYLLYGRVCSLGEQLQRLYSRVPKAQAHAVILDDLKKDTRKEYQEILAFLDVSDYGYVDFNVYNSAKEWRSYAVRRVSSWIGQIKARLRITGGLGILSAIDGKNMRVRQRPLLSRETRLMLIEYFREDVQLLQSLLQRDLGHWLHL